MSQDFPSEDSPGEVSSSEAIPEVTSLSATTSTTSARLKWLVRLALGVLLVAFLLSRGNIGEFWRLLRQVPPVVPLGAVLFYWALQCLSVTKWRLLLHSRGAHFSFAEGARLYMLGMFCNLFLPTTIGGDGVRAVLAGRRCGGTAMAASSILVERLTGLAALLTIGAVGVALWGGNNASPNSTSGAAILPRVFVVLALAAFGFAALRAVAFRLEKSVGGRGQKLAAKWARLHREIDFYAGRERWGTLALSLGISFVFQSGLVALNIVLARAAGLQTPVTTFLWLVPLLSLMAMIPIGIGGLGVREAVAVAALGQGMGHDSNAIVAWSLLYQATVWLASLPGALFLKDVRRDA